LVFSEAFFEISNGASGQGQQSIFEKRSVASGISRYDREYGLIFTCAVGLFLLGIGAWTSAEQIKDSNNEYGACYWVQNLVTPIPSVVKPLLNVPGTPQGKIAAALVLFCDFDFDLASGYLSFCEDAL